MPETASHARRQAIDQAPPVSPRTGQDDGSLVAEYGLIAVLCATIVAIAISWAQGGAIFRLFGAVLDRALGLVGAG